MLTEMDPFCGKRGSFRCHHNSFLVNNRKWIHGLQPKKFLGSPSIKSMADDRSLNLIFERPAKIAEYEM